MLPELAELLRADWPYPAEAITVVDGALDGIDRVARQLVRLGDHVAVENPSFPPFLDMLERLGYQRKQTPANAERYVTPALKELELRLQNAEDEALELERRLYAELVNTIASAAPTLLRTSTCGGRISISRPGTAMMAPCSPSVTMAISAFCCSISCRASWCAAASGSPPTNSCASR